LVGVVVSSFKHVIHILTPKGNYGCDGLRE